MRSIAATRFLSVLSLAGSVCFTAACGIDPPPAPGQAAATVAPETPKPRGMALAERPEWTLPTANASGARCNLETLAGQSLDGVHPTIAASGEVAVQGWYAFTPQAASVDAPEQPAAPAGTAPAAAPAAGKPVLVIARESGGSHWVVELPAFRVRRDVAKAFDDPQLEKSGFDVELDLSGMRPGFYSLHLSDDAHSAASVCGLGRGFVIK